MPRAPERTDKQALADADWLIDDSTKDLYLSLVVADKREPGFGFAFAPAGIQVWRKRRMLRTSDNPPEPALRSEVRLRRPHAPLWVIPH